jgi:acyl-CoA thioesterase FadM
VTSARATVKNVAINNDSFQPVPISDEWRRRFQRFKDA